MLPLLKSTILSYVEMLGYKIVRIPRHRTSVTQRLPQLRSHDDEIVSDVKAHLAAAPVPVGLPELGERWGAYARRLRSRIEAIRTTEELLELGQSPDAGVETHFDPIQLTEWCRSSDARYVVA